MSNPRLTPGGGGRKGGNPPEEYRFKPGQSGNPRGRPKKDALAGKNNPLIRAFEQAFLEEANRPITMTDGGKQFIMSASQAVLRATFVSALKGSTHAQRTILTTGLEIERRLQEEHARLFGTALQNKLALSEALHDWKARGRSEADFPLHPDDIVIEPDTLDVKSFVPVTAEGLQHRAELIKLRNELLEWSGLAEEVLAEDPSAVHVRSQLEVWREQIAELNGLLPPGLRRGADGSPVTGLPRDKPSRGIALPVDPSTAVRLDASIPANGGFDEVGT